MFFIIVKVYIYVSSGPCAWVFIKLDRAKIFSHCFLLIFLSYIFQMDLKISCKLFHVSSDLYPLAKNYRLICYQQKLR